MRFRIEAVPVVFSVHNVVRPPRKVIGKICISRYKNIHLPGNLNAKRGKEKHGNRFLAAEAGIEKVGIRIPMGIIIETKMVSFSA